MVDEETDGRPQSLSCRSRGRCNTTAVNAAIAYLVVPTIATQLAYTLWEQYFLVRTRAVVLCRS